MIRDALSLVAGCLVPLPVIFALGEAPRAPLSARLAFAQADLAAAPCATDSDCSARAASHGLAPEYFDAPDDWLSEACDHGDETACAYFAAWRDATCETVCTVMPEREK